MEYQSSRLELSRTRERAQALAEEVEVEHDLVGNINNLISSNLVEID